jgi:hypothetical protein
MGLVRIWPILLQKSLPLDHNFSGLLTRFLKRAPGTVTQSLPFILTSVALRKAMPSGVGGYDETARRKLSHAAHQ